MNVFGALRWKGGECVDWLSLTAARKLIYLFRFLKQIVSKKLTRKAFGSP